MDSIAEEGDVRRKKCGPLSRGNLKNAFVGIRTELAGPESSRSRCRKVQRKKRDEKQFVITADKDEDVAPNPNAAAIDRFKKRQSFMKTNPVSFKKDDLATSRIYASFKNRRYARRKTILRHIQNEVEETEKQEDLPKKDPPIQIFRRIARLVRLLCGVCLAIRRYAVDAGLLDNYMVQVSRKAHTKDGEESEEELNFDIKDFKLHRELRVSESMLMILDKMPDHRTPSDIHAIGRMMRGLQSFRKYTRDMQDMLCRIIRYMRCGKNRVVLRKGHIGYYLYFIYSGSVSVVLDKDEGNVFVKPEVVYLRKGACFGEIALLQASRRNATIVCAEETEFLWVDKEEFIEKGLDTRMQQEFLFRYHFFRQWPALSTWTNDEIKSLSFVSRMEEYHHNKVIVRDSKKNEWLWFIVKGSCDIVRLVELESCQSYRHGVLTGPDKANYVTGKPSKSSRCRHPQSARPRLQVSTLDALCSLSSPTFLQETAARPQTSTGFRHDSKNSGESPKLTSKSSYAMRSQRKVSSSSSSEDTSGEDYGKSTCSVKASSVRSTSAPAARSSSRIRPASAPDGRCGIFVKVDTLRDGQCFGLDCLFDDVPVHTVSLVSKGCEVIHVPRPKFVEMSNETTLTYIKTLTKPFPQDDDLCKQFIEKSRWDSYKREVVEKVVSEQQKNVGFHEMLRSSKRSDYLHSLQEDATLQDWLSRSKATASSSFYGTGPTAQVTESQPLPRTVPLKSSPGSSKDDQTVHETSPPKRHRRRIRPKTCPPGIRVKPSPVVTNARIKTTPMVAAVGRCKPTLSASSPLETDVNGVQTTTTVTKKGYKVQRTDLFASGSGGVLNLVHTVKSPSHENRMKLLRMV